VILILIVNYIKKCINYLYELCYNKKILCFSLDAILKSLFDFTDKIHKTDTNITTRFSDHIKLT